jgi:hypothetical protein
LQDIKIKDTKTSGTSTRTMMCLRSKKKNSIYSSLKHSTNLTKSMKDLYTENYKTYKILIEIKAKME